MCMGINAEGRFASYYDLFFDRVLRPIRRKNKEIITAHHCKKIIDLGCGTGAQCELLSANNLSLIGIDNSFEMLQVAIQKKIYNASFILGDAALDIVNENSFDCAIITLVLHPNDSATIKNIINQSLKLISNDGIIVITDYDNETINRGKIASKIIQIIESLTIDSHRSNYKTFMNNGALESILRYEGYEIRETYSFYHGAIKTCVIP